MSQMPNAKFDFIDFRFAGNLLDASHPVEKNWKLQGLPEIRPIVRRNSSYKWTFFGDTFRSRSHWPTV